jgi:tetratricopeptide (TPR) repeat protein
MGATTDLREGDQLGRYVVLHRIGSGAMGVVYAAYDPELDRRVAVKLLGTAFDGSFSEDHAARQTRLRREAQAMARLSHPNLVKVHDVGTLDDRVFLAMEFIEGPSLATWLEDSDRPWQQVLEVFRQVGLGLAAAHGAGLVHCDFKPENVLLARDGRVVVTDFGLAAVSGDAAADQFSFCVALYRGLHGRRNENHVPAWLRRAVLQGLAVDPRHRHRDMRALLAALGRTPARHWGTLGAVTLPVVALVGLVALDEPQEPPSDYCDDLPAHFAGIWDEAKKGEIEAAFSATATPYAHDAWMAVRDKGDAYVRAWLRLQGDACRDQANETEAQAALAMRMTCLQGQLARVDAITRVLGRAEASTVLRALETVGQLPSPDDCENIDLLTKQGRIREHIAVTDRRRLDELLSRSAALFGSAAYDQGNTVAHQALQEARALGDRWAEAEALASIAMSSEFGTESSLAESRYHEALTAALAAENHACVADVTIGLIRLAHGDRALADAERWARHGRAAVQSLGGDLERETHFALALGGTYIVHASYDKAEQQLNRAVEFGERVGPSARDIVGGALANLGNLAAHHGRFEQARQRFERAHAVLEEVLGPHHPTVGSMLINLGGVYGELGDMQRAHDHYMRALEVLESTLGPDHPTLATAHRVLAWALFGLERFPEAIVHADRALQISQASFGDDHADVAQSLSMRSTILVELQDEQEAIASAERALAIARSIFDDTHPRVALYEVELAIVLGRMNHPQRAKDHAKRGLALREARFGRDDGEVGRASLVLAELELDGLRRPDRARPHAERALAIVGDANPGNSHRIGEAAFMLAKVWFSTGGAHGRARARKFAEQARTAYDASGDGWVNERDEVDAWLRANLSLGG